MQANRKIALFGGSFNPIHIGHLALANFICESGLVDELWFLLTPENPLKKNDILLDEQTRLEMVKLAIGEYSKFKASDFEFKLPRPSYTINTLNTLQKEYPKATLYWIIGADNWHIFDQWKNAEEILCNYNLLIYPRDGYPINTANLPSNVYYLDSPIIEVSSTFIRNSIQNNKEMLYFTHPKVAKYIKEHKLYK